jgi:hypothetical protein
MTASISDTDRDLILGYYWDDIACFAFDGYHNNGRGVVALEKAIKEGDPEERELQMKYVIYDYEAGKPDKTSARLIENYDPNWEIVIQYLREDGSVHTMKIKTAPGASHPWRVWIFDRLSQDEENEERESDESND